MSDSATRDYGPGRDEPSPLMYHLVELAQRLRRILIAVIIMTVVLSFVPVDTESYIPLVSYFPRFVLDQVLPRQVEWKGQVYTVEVIQSSPFGGFNLILKSALMLGLLGASPVIAYELYTYIEPALYPHERRKLRRLLGVGIALFLIGVIVAFKLVLPTAFKFMILASIAVTGGERLLAFTDIENLFTTIVLISIATGIAFETPLIVYLAISFGVLDPKWFRGDNIRYVFAASMLMGALISPDPSGIGMIVIGSLMFLSIMVAAKLGMRSRGLPGPGPDRVDEHGDLGGTVDTEEAAELEVIEGADRDSG